MVSESEISDWIESAYGKVTVEGSQNGEDLAILRMLPDERSVYVDVGAAHPIECSNTWRMYQAGWRGLLIEPRHEVWQAILAKRPGDFLWPGAVGASAGHGVLRVYHGISSLLPEWILPEETRRIVQIDTLTSVLDKFPRIRDECRVCSVDVEGMERDVLLGIDWATFRPEVFCVEWIIFGAEPPDDDNSPQWRGILEAQGYVERLRSAHNLIFQRTE